MKYFKIGNHPDQSGNTSFTTMKPPIANVVAILGMSRDLEICHCAVVIICSCHLKRSRTFAIPVPFVVQRSGVLAETDDVVVHRCWLYNSMPCILHPTDDSILATHTLVFLTQLSMVSLRLLKKRIQKSQTSASAGLSRSHSAMAPTSQLCRHQHWPPMMISSWMSLRH